MIAPTVAHLELVRDDGQPLEFIPGQFIQVHFEYADGTPTKRSYSLATVHDHAIGPGEAVERDVGVDERAAGLHLLRLGRAHVDVGAVRHRIVERQDLLDERVDEALVDAGIERDRIGAAFNDRLSLALGPDAEPAVLRAAAERFGEDSVPAAIVMTLVGVFANVADRRTSVMLRLEAYLDNLSARTTSAGAVATGTPGFSSPMDMSSHVAGFAQSVARLEASVVRFESGLNQFSDTSRDLHEFNRHLRDNVQRLSLTFADLSNNLQHQVRELKSGGK